MDEPLVSVCIITFNQEKYIGRCIEGCLEQQTSFKYEILVGEDDSSDGTRQICLDYANRNPEKIRLFLHDRKNIIYIKGRPTGRRNFINNIKEAKGKYLAFCDGDDYWTDPRKLQKQVDFLEKNPNYGLVHSDFDRLIELNKKVIPRYNSSQNYKTWSDNPFEDILAKRMDIKTTTAVVLTDLIIDCFNTYPELFSSWRMADLPIWLHIAKTHKVGYVDESLAMYRVLEESASNNFNDRVKGYEFHNSFFEIKDHFIQRYGCTAETRSIVEMQKQVGDLTFAFYLNNRPLGRRSYQFLRSRNQLSGMKTALKLKLYYIGLRIPPVGYVLRRLIRIRRHYF